MKKYILPLLLGWASIAQAQPDDMARLVVISRQFSGPVDKMEDGSTYPLDLSKINLRLPRLLDPKMDRVLQSPRTIYYKLAQTYQQWIPPNRSEVKNLTFGSTSYTISPPVWGIYRTTFLPDMNANPDFPWETTIGLNISHRNKSKLYSTVNFMSLPEDENGRLTPVLLLVDERPIKWIFPPGTIFGEIIYTTHEGVNYVQEVRTRTKSDDNRTHFPAVFRPVADRVEFQQLVGVRYEPGKRFMSFRNLEEDEVMKLEGTVERLPNINAEVTKAILSRPFKDVTSTNWSPAPDQDFAILPKDYSFGLISTVDSVACAACHRQTQISVRNLIPNELNIIKNPSKVGNIRGSDGFFTWHPFSDRSVQHDDMAPMDRTIYTRAFDTRNGLVRFIHRGQQPPEGYKLTKFVQDSLKPYELPDMAFLHKVREINPPDDGIDPRQRLSLDGRQVMTDNGSQSFTPQPKAMAQSTLTTQEKINNAAVMAAQKQAVASQDQYVWRFNPQADPKTFYQWTLERGSQVVGVWDETISKFRPMLSDGSVGAPIDGQQPPPGLKGAKK